MSLSCGLPEPLGLGPVEALSLVKAVADLTAQSKGQHLRMFKPVPQEVKKARARRRGEEFLVEICGRAVPAISTAGRVRAVNKGIEGADRDCESFRPKGLRVRRGEQRSKDFWRRCQVSRA